MNSIKFTVNVYNNTDDGDDGVGYGSVTSIEKCFQLNCNHNNNQETRRSRRRRRRARVQQQETCKSQKKSPYQMRVHSWCAALVKVSPLCNGCLFFAILWIFVQLANIFLPLFFFLLSTCLWEKILEDMRTSFTCVFGYWAREPIVRRYMEKNSFTYIWLASKPYVFVRGGCCTMPSLIYEGVYNVASCSISLYMSLWVCAVFASDVRYCEPTKKNTMP